MACRAVTLAAAGALLVGLGYAVTRETFPVPAPRRRTLRAMVSLDRVGVDRAVPGRTGPLA